MTICHPDAAQFVGHALRWVYLDPIGALLLSIYIIQEWIGTLWECVRDLVGHRAEPIQHQVGDTFTLTCVSQLLTLPL